MQPEEFRELAALYALDLLDESDRRIVEDAIASSPELQNQLAEFRAAVAAIPYSTPTAPIAADLKKRLFERIASDVSTQDTTPVASQLISASVSALREQVAEVSWKPYSIPGIMVGKLRVDTNRREIACFMRAEAGVRFPAHRHAGEEEIVVLEGDLSVDGKTYGRGGYIRSAPGSVHSPETLEGCTIFVRTSLDNEMIDLG
jgi:anti-sigma factor ChrR (cupin superfamily)